MGYGSWSQSSFTTYAEKQGRQVDRRGVSSTQNTFTRRDIDPLLNPRDVMRECCDSEDHPESIPVILALDITGSMGDACRRTAATINQIMTELYKQYTDIEFLIMGIGDLAYDDAPIQASQYEADIRIAEQLDKVYMEMGGGGNGYESYTAAWYFGLYHTKLDCWKRGKKGIIITMGDEALNPYLPRGPLARATGDALQADVETPQLYQDAIQKFDIFHIAIDDRRDCYARYAYDIKDTWGKLLQDRFKVSTLDMLPTVVTNCIKEALENTQKTITHTQTQRNEAGEIYW